MDYAAHLEFFGIKLGLDQITELLTRLGNPDKALRFIHVAGTNGKGSVCAALEAGLRANGLKTGLYTSPHLISIRERFRINGVPISEAVMDEYEAKVKAQADAMAQPPSFFEFTTALAALLFADAKCDIVLWETGLGGRLDATNAVTPLLTVITRIGIDHAAHLGDTLEAVAEEKAGILKPGIPLVLGAQDPRAERAILERAQKLNIPLIRAPETTVCGNGQGDDCQNMTIDGNRVRFSLQGLWQHENAAVAYAALKYLSPILNIDLHRALEAWDTICWPARFQRIGDMIIDGAHNPDAAHALAETWHSKGYEQATILFAGFADKDVRGVLTALMPIAARFVLVSVVGAKGRPGASPDELCEIIHQINPAIPCETAADVPEALTLLKHHTVPKLVAGSLYLAGAVLSVMTAGSIDTTFTFGSAHQQRNGTVELP